ncbi:Transcription activator of gluconeogenesis [Colletotrichum fructicola Nara gc5]|uniref:Transcription activator of gluconeogenesis n=1 Tax=Colletotrichum fructicola (strain Nara gc5) TaxID=1213859 RepID=A0A7J6JL07_COLFN|nr:Transcription activator of gluconeogenesis [Colletotrichum fructicola]KAF4490693.1 Transcription activator of gluconeogenesis [Colletotrichum fructicola Nara gc5]KAF5509228.1 Transcription activator of gluconeogenesis [Colletotrichum fructicola]
MPDGLEEPGTEVSDAMSDNDHEYDDETPVKDDDDEKMAESHDSGNDNNGEVKKKYDPKDPSRPRRKKARRACFACQRAHLTCGDERPCQRCIKRGLADACQDGVRKKAKYLHDAPPEALRPVLGPNYNPNAAPARPNGQRHHSGTSDTASTAGSTYFGQSSTTSFPVYSGQQTPVAIPEGLPFQAQPSPISPSFPQPGGNNGRSIGGMISPQVTNDPFNTLFDPSNPAIFNFDLEGLNFGSQYGAMEFGMLGHMSSGAAETPPRDGSLSGPSGEAVNFGSTNVFGNGNNQFGQVYDSGSPSGNFGAVGNSQTISAPSRPKAGNNNNNKPGQPQKSGPHSLLGKRQRDPSSIYDTVKEPYPYLAGFHALIEYLPKRFSANRTLRIAKALASIRPSFIACTKTLSRQDLIFMEKCFQRTLFEYEEFMHHCSAPTIVLRRTGEIAAVNKEFIALTGWTKDVLLGNDPNLNVNTGGTPSSATNSGRNTGRAGFSTPKVPSAALVDQIKNGEGGAPRKQPVFIAEILDDDSVVEFYDDFSHLAFGDSRGSVNRTCRVLKYRTKEQTEAAASSDMTPQQDPRKSILSNRVTRIDGEHGISKIEKDGKVDCRYCWMIKRDVFDIPMLIVVNFLPCYYQNKEPHQLAV